MKRTLWPYVATVVQATSWKAALALGLMVGLSLTEGIGLLMLVPLLHLVGIDVQHGALGRIAQGEDEGREHDNVLGPLLRPQRGQGGKEGRRVHSGAPARTTLCGCVGPGLRRKPERNKIFHTIHSASRTMAAFILE